MALATTAEIPPRTRGRRTMPSLDHETWLWANGFSRVAGVDEAGRGALAGPLVAAAVILPPDPARLLLLDGVRDSKLLTPGAREAQFERVHACALGVGVGVVAASLVDGAGLAAAGQLAFRRAVASLAHSPDFLLLDAFRLRGAPVPQLAVIRGDARCLSVAAASVVAKVTRDRLMRELHERFPRYAFDKHVGYGTAAHHAALLAHGPCLEHRRSYAPVRAQCGR